MNSTPRVTNDELTIAIPTRDSAKYIDLIVGFYREHGLRPKMFVDLRSQDQTFEIASRLTDTMRMPNCTASIVEGLLPRISEECGSKWILRIDDDELPSLAMLQFVNRAIADHTTIAYGFVRHQCAVSPAGALMTAPQHSSEAHRQWRLYQRTKVNFTDRVHSPGIEWDCGNVSVSAAPAEACLIHLDWALHTYRQRLAKVERYDSYSEGAGTMWRKFYLYEEAAELPLVQLGLPEFRSVAANIARRLPELCVSAI